MQNRKGAFWYGPAVEWRTGFGTLSGDYLFGGNKGEMANIRYGKPFDMGSWSIEPHADLGWLSGRYVDYYYGVRQSEERAGRPAYTGNATLNVELGTRVSYRLTSHQNVTLDIGVTRLGGEITKSPLVGKRLIPQAKIGYVYQFK
ncbi:MipA/OmpV family protein [Paraburkholderia dipogonis]